MRWMLSGLLVGCAAPDPAVPVGEQPDRTTVASTEELDWAPAGSPWRPGGPVLAGPLDCRHARTLGSVRYSDSSDRSICEEGPVWLERDLIIATERVTHLANLGCVCAVEGSLRIEGTALVDLRGLNPMSWVGELEINGNPQLEDLRGLEQLTWVYDRLTIANNPQLVSLRGLDGLDSAGWVTLDGLDSLQTLDALDPFTETWELRLSRLPALRTVDGLGKLRRVNQIELRYLPALESLEGLGDTDIEVFEVGLLDLPALDSFDGSGFSGRLVGLTLERVGLTDFSGLERVTSLGRLELTELDRLVSFEGLESVTTIDSLTVVGTGAHTFEGLSGVDQIRVLEVSDSDANLSGTAGPVAINGWVRLSNLPQLDSLAWLSKVERIGSQLSIDNAPKLDTLDDLQALRELDASLHLVELPLRSVDGLSGLTHLGDLRLDNLPQLDNLGGLSNVEQTTDLYLHWVPRLASLDDLSSLQTVTGQLSVLGMADLRSLDGLGVEQVDDGVDVRNNPGFEDAHVWDWLDGVAVTGAVTVSGNGP